MRLESRVESLCKRLGTLWSENEFVVMDDTASQDKLEECKVMLFGQYLSNLNINFQTFQTTMKKAWMVENVVIKQMDSRIMAITFNSKVKKNRVFDNGFQSFMSNLLLLKPWKPKYPSPPT